MLMTEIMESTTYWKLLTKPQKTPEKTRSESNLDPFSELKIIYHFRIRRVMATEPIMCIIFGLSLREKRMTIKGFRNTSVSLVICIIVGILFGIPAHFISMFQDVAPYPTQEMSGSKICCPEQSRDLKYNVKIYQKNTKHLGEAKALIASVIVAVASGVSVSFAILSNSLAAMIGNAISLSLLPPSVNCVSHLEYYLPGSPCISRGSVL
ncbi:hypothetical protein ACTXT7_014147 [Hymenolepis weldensis]